MRIGGFQRLSLLDYPDRPSAIIWTIGCNFRCPFCYNKKIVFEGTDLISEKQVLCYLEKRKNFLEGVVITGGEPLIQHDLKDFIREIKKIGYFIKIDTNGANPKRLRELIEERLVDYVSMDVKAPKGRYGKTVGTKVDIAKIEESIELIKQYAPDYEFRTTLAPKLLEKGDILEIAEWLKGSKRYFLQQFERKSPLILPTMEKVKPYSKEYLRDTLKEIEPYFKECGLRGV